MKRIFKKSRLNSQKNLLLVLFICIVLWAIFTAKPLYFFAQESEMANGEVTVKGISLQIDPDSQDVPVNTATVVNTIFSADTPDMLAGLVVKGELLGPGLSGAVTLSTLPNHPFSIPALPIKGTYYLEDVRLEKEGVILLKATPDRAEIDVIDVVVTRVETRQLSLQEIRDKGIVVSDENFTCYNFSVGFVLESREVVYDFPVIFRPSGDVQIIGAGGTGGMGPGIVGGGGGMVPFNLKIPDIVYDIEDSEEPGTETTIPGILVFNNEIAFLNQFFSVMFIISNNAPDGSSLTLKNIEATLALPEGLREAKTNPPHVTGTPIPVRCPGPDGKLGTADDLDIVIATFSGMAEFLAEGLEEGSHTVKIDFSAVLSGLPSGDVDVQGTAVGAVMVRNPEFSITFSHPSVVRSGEQYDIYVSLTNISPVTANLVSLAMPASNLIGTSILSEESVGFETIEPGESKTAKFHMLSLQTGEIRASAFRAEGHVKGKFELYAGVGEEGIPLSPDSITLPRYAYSLPGDIVNAALQLLGEAYCIATTPPGGLPANLPYVTREAVSTRIVDLTEAGQRIYYGETDFKSAAVLALDWQGNRHRDLPFDILRRLTGKGTAFAAQLAVLFNQYLSDRSPADFHEHFAETCSYKNPFVSALLSFDGSSRSAVLKVTDFYHNLLSNPGTTLNRDIPFGEIYSLQDNSASPVDFSLLGTGDEHGYTVEILGQETGNFDLSLIVPDGSGGCNLVTFAGVNCQAGASFSITVNSGDTAFALTRDIDGDGYPDSTLQGDVHHVNKPALQLVSAVQDCSVHAAGHAVALLFNREVDPDTAKVANNFFSVGKKTYGSYLQPSGRVILVGFNNPISPFVQSSIRVANLVDMDGGPLNPSPAEAPIRTTIETPGGIVYGQVLTADGQPVANAQVQLIEEEEGDVLGRTRSYAITDESGNYQFDYVRILIDPFIIEVLDPETGKIEKVKSRLWTNGQRYLLNVIIRGRGSLTGRVLTTAGTPVADAYVGAKTENNTGIEESFSGKTGANGVYLLSDIPIGRINLYAVSGSLIGSASAAISAPGELAATDITVVGGTFANVTGRVLETDTITPVADTYVILTTERCGERLTRSDENGYFKFPSVPTGKIIVQAYNPVTGKKGGRVDTTLSEGEEFNATIILRGSGSISGKVLSYNGAPQPGILVFVSETNYYMDTDQNGEFSFTGVPVGEYNLTAYDRSTYLKAYGHVYIPAEGDATNITLVFSNPLRGGVTGKVYQPGGTVTIPGTTVYLSNGAYQVLQQTQADANGNYYFNDLSIGSYYVTAVQGSLGSTCPAVVKFPGHFPTANIIFRGTGSVIINVLDDKGETGIMTKLEFSYTSFEFKPGNHIGFLMKKGNYSTDENGHIEFKGVLTGAFNGHVVNPFYPDNIYFSGNLTTPGTTETISLKMPPMGAIAGIVVNPDGVTPVPNARITLKSNYLVYPPIYSLDTPGQEGRFSFALVPPGGFAIEAQIGQESIPQFFYQGRISSAVGKDGETVNVTVRLKGKGLVTGFVKKPDGTPVPNARVSIKTIGFPYYEGETRSHKADENEPGRFTFSYVPEGSFALTALDDQNSYLGGRASGTIQSHGEEVNTDIFLKASGTVSGRVLNPDGSQAVVSAQVVLYSSVSDYPFGFFMSDQDGSFLFNHVPVGSFRVEALDPVSGRRGKTGGAIANDGQVAQIDVHLEGRGTVSGAFYDASQMNPVAGAEVKIISQGQFPFDMVMTSDSGGNFNFGQVGQGTFTLEATGQAAGLIGKADGEIEYDGHETRVNIYAEGTGIISGRVLDVDGQTPIGGAKVTLVSGNKTYSAWSDQTNGEYRFETIPLKSFTLTATHPTQSANYGRTTGSLTFHGQELTIDIPLRGVGAVTGILRDGGGTPLSGHTVFFNCSTWNTSTATDSGGHFTFADIPLVSFSLKATTVTGLSASGSGQITSAGEVLTIDLTLQEAGQVKGKLFNPDGATPADKAYVRLKGNSFNQYTSTDAAGNFLFDAVRPGDFTVYMEGYNESGLARVSGAVNANGDVVDFGSINLDDQPPQVTTIFPGNGSTNLPHNTPITITFSENMAAGTINSTNIQVLAGSIPVPGSLSLQGDQKTAIFIANPGLSSFTLYTIKVKTAVEDTAGNTLPEVVVSTFITSDTAPPMVAAVSPGKNATGVSPNAIISITFNEPVDTGVFSSANITLTKAGLPTAGSLSFNESGMVATFTPAAVMATDAEYLVSVNGVKDLVGNVQTTAFTATFYTTDTIPPVLQLIDPGPVIEGSTATITANATPTTDVVHVYFFKDGQHVYTDNNSPYLYQFTAPLLADQGTVPILVEALAVDAAGNQSVRANLPLTLIPDTAPQATMTMYTQSPIEVGKPISCRVVASDDYRIIRTSFSAVGGGISYWDNGGSTGKYFDHLYGVPVPADILPGSDIIINFSVTDSMNHTSVTPEQTIHVKDDTALPTVHITSPLDGESFDYNETLAITASASDDAAVARVKFFLKIADLPEQLLLSDTKAPYQAAYTVLLYQEDQAAVIRAEASDLTGKTANHSVGITLKKLHDVTAPTVKIISPTKGSLVFPGEKLKIITEVSDDEGVARVNFSANDGIFATASESPYLAVYTVPEDAPESSTIQIKVTGIDVDNKETSEQVTVYVKNGTHLPGGTVINADNTDYENVTIIIKEGTAIINGVHTFENILVKENGVLTHSAATSLETYKLDLTVTGQVVVAPDALIDVSSRGYLGGYQGDNATQYGHTLGFKQGSFRYSGAGYGGYGAGNGTDVINEIYGSVYLPTNAGSGGGGYSSSEKGGSGGGVINLKAGGLIIDGSIRSNGGNITGTQNAGCGSGGSIRVETENLSGSGGINADGGSFNYVYGQARAGGGGRIAIYFSNAQAFSLDNITVYGGTYANGTCDSFKNGSAGTVYLKKEGEEGEIFINNNGLTSEKNTRLITLGGPGTITAIEAYKLTDANANFIPGSLVGMELIPNVEKYKTFTIIENNEHDIFTDPTGASMIAPLAGESEPLARVGDHYDYEYPGNLVFNSNTVIDGTGNFANVTLINAEVLANETLNVRSLTLQDGSVLTHSPATTSETHSLTINANEIVIFAGCKISADSCGYLGAFQGGNVSYYGQTLNFAQGSYHTSGASYGGYGGQYAADVVNGIYGSIYEPAHPGSGGGGQMSTRQGGNGGGVIKINASELVVNGSIQTNGGNAGGLYHSGGGAGGSILVRVNTISGSGSITANGGAFSSTTYSSGGGGGRIALYYSDAAAFDLSRITAYGGTYSSGSCEDFKNGSAGTIYLKKEGIEGELVVDNCGRGSDNPLIFPVINPGTISAISGINNNTLSAENANYMPGALVGMILQPETGDNETTFSITANTDKTITVDGDLSTVVSVGAGYCGKTVFPEHLVIRNTPHAQIARDIELNKLSVIQNSVLSQPYAAKNSISHLSIKAQNSVSVDAASRIDVSSRGYLGGFQGDNASYYGQTLDFAQGSYHTSGASHGGRGGQHDSGAVNEVYGSVYEPVNPGSGGGGQSITRQGGNGGGILKIETSELALNGSIRSDGGSGIYHSGGGSGGSILINANTLSGSGWITAHGGAFSSATYSSAGGGGRVAVYYTAVDGFDLSHISACGGTFSGGSCAVNVNGGAGTVYLKKADAVFGDLIVNNNNISSPANSTTLPSLAKSSVPANYDTLTAYELIDNDANFIAGAFTGLKLNPAPLANRVFTIIGNNATTIRTDPADGDMTQFGSGLYTGVHQLFNLTVKGNAQLFTYDRIFVTGILTVAPGSSLQAENHNQ